MAACKRPCCLWPCGWRYGLYCGLVVVSEAAAYRQGLSCCHMDAEDEGRGRQGCAAQHDCARCQMNFAHPRMNHVFVLSLTRCVALRPLSCFEVAQRCRGEVIEETRQHARTVTRAISCTRWRAGCQVQMLMSERRVGSWWQAPMSERRGHQTHRYLSWMLLYHQWMRCLRDQMLSGRC